MRNLFSAMIGLSLLICTSSLGQGQPPPPQRPGPLLERLPQLLEGLELTEEQRRQIDQTIEEARRDLQELRREAADLLPRERIARMEDLVRELRDEVMSALDEEQRETLRRRIDRLQERWRETGPAREQLPEVPGRMIHRLRESMRQLDLTPEQREEINQILSETREQMQEMQQQLEEEMHRRREEVRQLFEQTREELHDVLTPEQRQRLREVLPPRTAPPESEDSI